MSISGKQTIGLKEVSVPELDFEELEKKLPAKPDMASMQTPCTVELDQLYTTYLDITSQPEIHAIIKKFTEAKFKH